MKNWRYVFLVLLLIFLVEDVIILKHSYFISEITDYSKTILTKIYSLLPVSHSVSDQSDASLHPMTLVLPPFIPLQQVNNVGYSFYLGQIDYSEAPAIGDDTKNTITKVIYEAKFPKKFLNNIAIVIVNTLANNQIKYIETPHEGYASIPNFSPDFLTGGGCYSQTIGKMSFIFINSKKLGRLSDILTHELGHHIGSQLTEAEWQKFYQLRNIPSGTVRHNSNWQLSPEEDFAEVYKNIFTGLDIYTGFGLIIKNRYIIEYTCGQIYDNLVKDAENNYVKAHPQPTYDPKGGKSINDFVDENSKRQTEKQKYLEQEAANIEKNTQLQACRRNVMLYPEKYPKDYSQVYMGSPYKSTVEQSTKDFIYSIVNRLN